MRKTIKLSVGQAIIKFLDNQFLEVDGKKTKIVEGIFSIFGHGNVLGLGESILSVENNLRLYQGKNEQGMAHIATGFSRQNLRRKIIALTSSVGPGSANIVTAAATATANNIPMLIFPGDLYSVRQPDPVLQQMEFDHSARQSTNDAFKAVSQYWDRIERPEQLMSALLNAFNVLTDKAITGAVTICLPQDVQAEVYDYPEEFFQERIYVLDRNKPSDNILNTMVEKIRKAKKPLMVVGGGVNYSEAGMSVESIANKFGIPYASTQAGKGAVIYDGKYNLGGLGVTGTYSANTIANDADCIIGVGTKYQDFTTGSKSIFNEKANFVNINVSNRESAKMDGYKVVGDAKAVLEFLEMELEKLNYKTSYTNEIIDVQNEWKKIKRDLKEERILIQNKETERVVKEFKKIFPTHLYQTSLMEKIQEIIKSTDKDAVVVSAAGSLPGDLQRLWDVESLNSYHVEYGYSCMGYEIAAAIGVKMAEPWREVYAFVGDGSFLMLHSEIMTAIQENLKINILLFDNSGWGCIDNLQTSNGIVSNTTHFRKRDGKDNILSGEMMDIDYSMIAKGYGCDVYNVTDINQLEETFINIKKSKTVTLTQFKVLPKTMTEGFNVWWRVGLNKNSNSQDVIEAEQKLAIMIEKAKSY